ncbi:hypothetical protein BpHYR1_043453 [Brachionus plicatilis]|uniref:Uncharacterized protein n=1 Tax=Brachionus plicatilis TaxID=10195 RepID=A0A3M7RNB7_BRAPC|nr:hypothetical protein BpHYR1_043453 [Brachionus plicatilis]
MAERKQNHNDNHKNIYLALKHNFFAVVKFGKKKIVKAKQNETHLIDLSGCREESGKWTLLRCFVSFGSKKDWNLTLVFGGVTKENDLTTFFRSHFHFSFNQSSINY